MKKGLIIASFGTTHEDTRRKNISRIENHIDCQFKDVLTVRAFTSRIVKKRLFEKEKFYVFNEKEAYYYLQDRGILDENIYVQPLHIIPGSEFGKLQKMENIYLGEPLLTSKRDLTRFTKINFDIDPQDALILFGHGSEHENDQIYYDLQDEFIAQGIKNVFIVNVEGSFGIEKNIENILNFHPRKIILQPLMIVAGDHAKNDMASAEDDSLKSLLEAQGFKVEARIKGLGEMDEVVEMYLEKTEKLLNGSIDTTYNNYGYLLRGE